MARSGLSPVMVGRDAELSELQRCFAQVGAADDGPPVVVVSGEAGVGKTRLLRELQQAISAPVLAGQADEQGPAGPFALVRSALEQVVASWDEFPESLAAWEHVARHVLSPLLDEHPRGPEDDHEHTSDELVRVAVELFRFAVGDQPTVLVFEDLHWADAESIALLSRLATTQGLPVLLVATFRPEDFDRRHPLAAALPVLERRRTVRHLALDRLTGVELAQMLEAVFGESVPSRVVGALHARTGGNPFFVEELVEGCGCAEAAELVKAPLPWNAAEAVLRRLDGLEDAPRRVLDAASLLGSRIPFDLLASVAGADEAALILDLRALLERGLLTEVEPDVFAFRHALTREAVAGQLLGREQRAIHQAALEWLEANGSEDVVALAYRAAGARQPAKLAVYARRAAERSLQEGSSLRALEVAELALSEDALDSGDEALALHAAAAQAAWGLGLDDTTRRHSEAWLAEARGLDDAEQQSAALRQLALARWDAGDERGYRDALERALDVAESLGPSQELSWVLSYRSQAELLTNNPQEALAWADRALEMAATVEAPRVRAYALVNKGTVLTELHGHEEEGLALLAQAREEAARLHDGVTLLRAYNNALAHLLHAGVGARFEARRLLEEMEAAADRYGKEVASRKATLFGFRLALIEGDRDAAVAELEQALATDAYAALVITLNAFQLEIEGTGTQVASDLLEEAARRMAAAPFDDERVQRLQPVLLRARVALAARTGDRDLATSCLRALDEVPGPYWEGHGNPTNRTDAVLDAASAEVDVALLEAALERARAVANTAKPAFAAEIAHAEAAVAERRGDAEAAVERYRAALEVADLPRPAMRVADARVGLARCLIATGAADEAAAQLGLARAALERWPGWRRAAVEALLSRLSRQSQDPDGLLTPRELEVLALIARGLSNQQIAETLYIARKTAAVHVSNILAKTGTSSRTQAAAWAHERSLLADAP